MNVRLVLPDEVVVSENPRDANSREATERMSSNAAGKENTLRVEWLSLLCTTGFLLWTKSNGPDKYAKDSMAIANDTRIMLVNIKSLLVLFLFMVGTNAVAQERPASGVSLGRLARRYCSNGIVR